MAVLDHIELPDGVTYDIYGKNVVDISYDDYQNLSEEQKNADIAYHIYNVPEEQAEPTNTVSGSIVSFDCGSAQPLKSLKVAINPVQDLHGYDHPWAGGAGKNKLNLQTKASTTVQGITSEVKDDNRIIASGTSTGNGDITCPVSSPFTMTAGNAYTISINGTDTRSGSVTIFFGTSYINAGSISIDSHSLTFTPNTNVNCNQVMFRMSNGRTITMNANIQIESGDTATDYEPYSNICPISGWDECKVQRTGKNLFNKATVTSRKGLNASGALINVDWCSVSDYIAVKPNTTYHMAHGVGNSSLCGGAYYTADKTFIAYINGAGQRDADFSFTTYNNVEYIRLNVTTANLNTAQIELGSTATTYEPYNGTTYPITWSEAGEVFGGYIDLERKKVVGTLAKVMLGDLNWAKNTTYGYYYTYGVNNTIKHYESARTAPLLCNIYDDCTDGLPYEQVPNGTIYNAKIGTTYIVCIKDFAYADSTSLTEALTSLGAYLVYELKTPIEYNLDLPLPTIQTLLGNNNIWSDTGEIEECVYVPSLLTQIRYNDKVYATPAYTPKAGDANTVSGHTVAKDVPSDAVFTDTDTKNTAGSTDTSSKIFLIGATSQAANPQTYSDSEVHTTSGVLTTKSVQVGGGAVTMEYSATTKSINFVFAS